MCIRLLPAALFLVSVVNRSALGLNEILARIEALLYMSAKPTSMIGLCQESKAPS
jgi:hypothetical protein